MITNIEVGLDTWGRKQGKACSIHLTYQADGVFRAVDFPLGGPYDALLKLEKEEVGPRIARHESEKVWAFIALCKENISRLKR